MAQAGSGFLEYKYFLSSDANVDLQCEVLRLELPLSSLPEDSAAEMSSSSEPPSPLLLKEELYVTAHVSCDGEPLHNVPISTCSPSTIDSERNSVLWDDLLSLPVKIRDLSQTARLVFTVWGIGDEPVGGTTLDFFDHNGVLRTGKQKLKFFFRRPGDLRGRECNTPGSAYDQFAEDDYRFKIEKARERYQFNRVAEVEWLDRLSLPHTSRILTDLSVNSRLALWSRPYYSQAEVDLMINHGFLVVNLPMFQHPVLFDEKAYPGVGLPPVLPLAKPALLSDDKSAAKAALLINHPSLELGVIFDCEAESDNPVENKYRKLAHDKFRSHTMDPNLKPNKEERERIELIVASPSDHLRIEDKDLLWTFRLSLTDNKKALTKFLLSVDWTVEQEVEQVPALLEQWKQKTTIDISDALKLLGRQKAFQNGVVRRFGVDTLRRASDDEILTYLLQLVQALRYESRANGGMNGSGATASAEDVIEAEMEALGGDLVDMAEASASSSSTLAQFLIERACGSLELANFLFWYLRVELDDSADGDVFKTVLDEFKRTLLEVNADLLKLLFKQEAYITRVAEAQRRAARDEKGKKDEKERKLRVLLAEDSLVHVKGCEFVPIPLDPSVRVIGVVPGSAFMFKSALYPAVIQFKVFEQKPLSPSESHEDWRLSNSTRKLAQVFGTDKDKLPVSAASSYKVIFKTGDDLRQDQLIIQMITLMDYLLKRVNLDLKLTPYRILATGPKDGLVEFVSGSLAVSEVLSSSGSILNFLRQQNPDPAAPFGVSPEAMSTFTKSCAGYCVMTYILGIGDRHLDNIMMLPAGNLFHIDFGFIFGNDPKLLPPPFRFTDKMAEAMGGEGHDNYVRFKRYCCQAYNCFRENASLILNLLSLMVDAGIKDLSSDPQTVLAKIEEKFRLDLTVEQAELYFVSLISESLTAVAYNLYEGFHKFAVLRR